MKKILLTSVCNIMVCCVFSQTQKPDTSAQQGRGYSARKPGGEVQHVGRRSVKNSNWQEGGLFNGYIPDDEILESRTEFTKKFSRIDGKIDVLFGGPFHYKAANGVLEDIDLTIQTQSDSIYKYFVEKNCFKTHFPEKYSNGLKLESKNKVITLGIAPSVRSGNWSPLSSVNEHTQLNGNTISYKELYQGIDLEYEVSSGMVKHRMVFANTDIFKNLVTEQHIDINEIIKLPSNTVLWDSLGAINTSRSSRGYIYVIASGDTIFTILPPCVWDASFDKSNYNPSFAYWGLDVFRPTNNYLEILDTNTVRLSSQIPVRWLQSSSRLYPVVFDPTVYVGSYSTTSLASNYVYPFNTCKNQRVSQILFRQSDIGIAGTISDISFYQIASNPMLNYKLNVSLKDVSYADMSLSPTYSALETGMTSCYYNSAGTSLNYSNQWIPAISLSPFSHANTNLLVEARFNNCGYTASCSYTCPPIVTGGRWGAFTATYSGHRWAYSNSSSCALNPPYGADCPSLEANPGLGNNVPFTRITISPTASCTGWAVTPSVQSVSSSGGTYSATVSTTVGGCTYYRNTSNSWITLGGTTSGGVFNYSVSNNSGAARTGYIYITDGVSTVCTLTINQSASCPTITPSVTHINVSTCYGNNNGSISVVSTSGGTPPYTYAIDGGGYGSSPNFTGLYAGPHTVSVRDFNGCIGTASRTLTEPSAISFTYTYHNVSCAACDNGKIVVTASGGSSYQYSKNGGSTWQSSNTFTGLVSGTYNVQVRQVGCPAGVFATVNLTPGAVNMPRSCAIKIVPIEHPQKKICEPIDIGTGSYSYAHTDINLPAIGNSLSFTRYYNTVNDTLDSQLGYGWSHSFDCYIRNFADTLWIVHYPDGHSTTFIPSVNTPGTSFPLFGGTYEKLNKNISTGIFTLTMKTGDVYQFNSLNKLQSITDANGNATTITYTGSNISSVTAPGGRIISFTYTGSKIEKITDPLGRVVEYNYTTGNLTSVTDANSGVTTFAYDGLHKIAQIINARGNTVITNTYDPSTGWITGQADGLGNTTTIVYSGMAPGDATITYPGSGSPHITVHHNASFCLTQETDELGHNKTYSYDNNFNLTDFTDENGNHTSYTYDNLGNKLTTAKPLSSPTSVSYLPSNRPSSITDPLSHLTSMDYYPGNVNVQAIHLPDGSTRNYTYYPNGLLKTSSDAYSHITTYNYNSFGDLTSVVSPSGTKNYTYDAAGRRTSEKDENGRITYYTYNNNDMVIEVKDPYGATVVDSFDANNNLTYIKDKNGNVTRVTYDVKDRVSKITNAVGGNKLFTYDVRDNTKTVTDENGNITIYSYDVKNRLIGKNTSLSSMSYGYDNADNLISETNATGASKHYAYDSLNRRVSVTDELGHTTNITYTAIGQIKKITDPLGANTNYTYNPVGLLTGILDAQGHTTSASYDLNGSRTDITDPNGHTQHFTFDASNRLSSYSDAAGNMFSYTYDAAGNLITETKPTGTITRTYDSLNRVRKIVNSGGDTYQYTYDANGNKVTVMNASGTSNFVYDSLNHLKKYTDMFGNIVQYTYDVVGNRKSIRYPGGNTVNYNYNSDNQMTSVTDWLGHITSYTYDANSRLASMSYPNGTTCTYGYDIASRLTSKINSMSSGVISKSIFLLDDNGNRTREQREGPIPFHLTADSFAYTYGPDDRLLSDSHTTYTNDASGNRTSAGTTSYNFSIDNILNSITTPTATTSFSYDGLGNRVKRTQAGNIRRYVLDLSNELSQVLVEQDNVGAVKATYIYGLGLIARVDSAGDFLYYHFDAQHNTVALTNDSGNVKDTYTYDPFGVMLKHTGNTQQPYTFLGEYGVQQETPSLYYVRARYYDAKNGRFIGKDIFPASLLNPQTMNRYVYGLDNPMSVFDVTGYYGNKDFISEFGEEANDLADYFLQSNKLVGYYWLSNGATTKYLGKASNGIGYGYLFANTATAVLEYKNGQISGIDLTKELFEELYPKIAGEVGAMFFGEGGRIAAEATAEGSIYLGNKIGDWWIHTKAGDKFTSWIAKTFY